VEGGRETLPPCTRNNCFGVDFGINTTYNGAFVGV
jgi:hypothetical protein